MTHPNLIHAGLTSIKDYMNAQDKETFNSTLQKAMPMQQQVERFQVRPPAGLAMHNASQAAPGGPPEGEYDCRGAAHCSSWMYMLHQVNCCHVGWWHAPECTAACLCCNWKTASE